MFVIILDLDCSDLVKVYEALQKLNEAINDNLEKIDTSNNEALKELVTSIKKTLESVRRRVAFAQLDLFTRCRTDTSSTTTTGTSITSSTSSENPEQCSDPYETGL